MLTVSALRLSFLLLCNQNTGTYLLISSCPKKKSLCVFFLGVYAATLVQSDDVLYFFLSFFLSPESWRFGDVFVENEKLTLF